MPVKADLISSYVEIPRLRGSFFVYMGGDCFIHSMSYQDLVREAGPCFMIPRIAKNHQMIKYKKKSKSNQA